MSELTDRGAVLSALAEYDEKGREDFLAEHGFGEAREFFLVHEGKEYDSKAIVGVAYGYQFPSRGPLAGSDFSGGAATVERVLRSLGFEVRKDVGSARLPKWVADEVILALDVYLRHGLLDDTDPTVIELSETLRTLPIHPQRLDPTFRNANGVALKLANFAALDPSYQGRGMTSASKLDREIWDRFHDRQPELAALAASIRAGASAGVFSEDGEEDEDEVLEGRLVFRRHRARERDRSIIKRKKARARADHGRLACEVCGIDFAERYGRLGEDFIECHHRKALSESGSTTTRLADLALICPNCHRMIHRQRPWLTVEGLRAIVEAQSKDAPGSPPAHRLASGPTL